MKDGGVNDGWIFCELKGYHVLTNGEFSQYFWHRRSEHHCKVCNMVLTYDSRFGDFTTGEGKVQVRIEDEKRWNSL